MYERRLSMMSDELGKDDGLPEGVEERRNQILQGIEAGERDIAAGRTIPWEELKVELQKWQRDFDAKYSGNGG